MKLLEMLIKVHTNPGDTILDFFCGSGTTGHAAIKNDRGYVMIDQNPEAISIAQKRCQTQLETTHKLQIPLNPLI